MKSRTKSPTPTKHTNKWQPQKQIDHLNSVKSPEFTTKSPNLSDLIYLFKKKIKSVIQMQQSLDQRRLPQRCQIHNSAFSLYSQSQRSLLCATCIYQKEKKRSNIIIPISQASAQLKQDINKNKQKINNKINEITSQMKKSQEDLERIQSQFPQYILKLQRHYTNLHEILVRKEKEHINQIRYLKDKSMYQHVAFTTQLNNIIHYLLEKMEDQINIDDNRLAFQHSIFNVLVQSQNIVKCQLPMTINSSLVSSTIFSSTADYLMKNLSLSLSETLPTQNTLKKQSKVKLQGTQANKKNLNKGQQGVRTRSQKNIIDRAKSIEDQYSFQRKLSNELQKRSSSKQLRKTPSKVRSYLQKSFNNTNNPNFEKKSAQKVSNQKVSAQKVSNQKKSVGKFQIKKNIKEKQINKSSSQMEYSFDKNRQITNQNIHKDFLNSKKQQTLKKQKSIGKINQ